MGRRYRIISVFGNRVTSVIIGPGCQIYVRKLSFKLAYEILMGRRLPEENSEYMVYLTTADGRVLGPAISWNAPTTKRPLKKWGNPQTARHWSYGRVTAFCSDCRIGRCLCRKRSPSNSLHRSPRHAKSHRDLAQAHAAPLKRRTDVGLGLRRQPRTAHRLAAAGAIGRGSGHARQHPFVMLRSNSQNAHHLKHRFAGRGGGVEPLLMQVELDALGVELGEQF